MNIWITKYALTTGILERELIETHGRMAVYRDRGGINDRSYALGNDWHQSKVAAVARAEEMRLAKIESHKKSIAKLEKLKFA